MAYKNSYEPGSVVLDYELHRSGSIIQEKAGTWLAVFSAGSFFPNLIGDTAYQIIWDFGDGVIETISVTTESRNEKAKLIDELSKYTGFFPTWSANSTKLNSIPVPEFRREHRYLQPGSYNVKATIITATGNKFVGKETVVTIGAAEQIYNVPDNWITTTSQYIDTEGSNLIFTGNSYPELKTDIININDLPVKVTFTLTGLENRTDVDYIEWRFGDGSVNVKDVQNAPITSDMLNVEHTYKMLPEDLGYKPTAIVHIKKGTEKYKFIVNCIDIIFRDRTNIGVGYTPIGNTSVSETKYPAYGFNVTPAKSDVLPVNTSFIADVSPELKYIFWDHEDGSYDISPIIYNPEDTFNKQVYIHTHKYTTISFDQYLPRAIFVYESSISGKLYSRLYRTRNFVRYDLGIFNRGVVDSPLLGIGGYGKFDGISMAPEYNGTQVADIYINLSLSTPRQLYLFEKIIWTVNGERIFQDKNTSKDFGFTVLRNMFIPGLGYNDRLELQVTAELYGRPSVYSPTGTNTELVLFGTYSFTHFFTDRETYLSNIENGRLQLNTIGPDLDDLGPIISVIGDTTTVLTPVVTSINTTAVTNFITFVSNRIIFDKLFDADYPISNFLNRDHPSTVSTVDLTTTLSRYDIGYFTPTVCTPVIVEPGKFSFTVNSTLLEFNTPYYFPDPFKYGSETEALNFSAINDSFKNSDIFAKAKNEPNVSEDVVPYAGYTSVKSLDSLHDVFDIANKGYVFTLCDDVYNNKYALVKDNQFKQSVIIPSNEYTINNTLDTTRIVPTVCLNGYRFYDILFSEGNAFNYYTPRTYGTEVIVPGLSTFTGSFSSVPTYTLGGGSFKNNNFAKSLEPFAIENLYKFPEYSYVDGATFSLTDSISVVDTISSDLTSFPGSGSYYFSTVYEGGVHIANPYHRPTLSSSPISAADFTQNVRMTVDNDVIEVDSGLFSSIANIDRERFTGIGDVIGEINPNSITSYVVDSDSTDENYLRRFNLPGSIYVKDHTGNVNNIVHAFDYMESKYQSILSQLSAGVLDIDIKNDTLFIQLSDTLIIDRFKYENNKFKSATPVNMQISYGNDAFNQLSNRYSINNDVYFVVLSGINTNIKGSQHIIPIIYRYNYVSATLKQLSTNTYAIPASTILYTGCSVPQIAYSTSSKTFDVVTTLKDQNNSPSLLHIQFKDGTNTTITSIQLINLVGDNLSTQFTGTSALSGFVAYISSAPFTFAGNNLVL